MTISGRPISGIPISGTPGGVGGGAINVRVFGYRGLRQIKQLTPSQLTGAISETLNQPYEWSQVVGVTPNSGVSGSTVKVQSDQARLVAIEVPDGMAVRYEFNITPGRNLNAGNASPRVSGFNLFDWLPGGTISLVDASVFP